MNKKTIKTVLALALPAVGEMILYMLIWVLDTMMVGQYAGNVGLTAVGLSSEIMYATSNIIISVGIAMGTTSLVARKVGAKDYEKTREYGTIGIMLTFVIGLTIGLVFFNFSGNILGLTKAEPEVVSIAQRYMRICSIGLFFNMQTATLNAILRGYGDTKTPLKGAIIINLVNISLDWVLIFGRYGFKEFGIMGAAIATVTANVLGFLYIAFQTYKYSKVKPSFRFIQKLNFDSVKGLIQLSVPSSMQEASFSVSRLLNTFMVISLGNIAFSANQITTTIESLSFMPGWGFAVATTTLVGQKVGENNIKGAKEYANTCLVLGSLVMGIASLIFLFFPHVLINLFIHPSEVEVIRLGTLCLMIAAIEQIPMAISMISAGALKGSGDTKSPFKVSFFSNWCIRLPLMYYVIYVRRAPVTYVWVITAIQWSVDAILMYTLYKKRINTDIIIQQTTSSLQKES